MKLAMKKRNSISMIFLILCSFFLLSIHTANAQEKVSIDFKDISFSEALTLAKESNKPIFIDCYTSWCAPCKKMDQTVFVNDTIYEFYNAHFVNLKIDPLCR